jgi:hypothetical protein
MTIRASFRPDGINQDLYGFFFLKLAIFETQVLKISAAATALQVCTPSRVEYHQVLEVEVIQTPNGMSVVERETVVKVKRGTTQHKNIVRLCDVRLAWRRLTNFMYAVVI